MFVTRHEENIMTTRQSDGSTVQSRANGHSGPPMPLRGIPLTDNARTVLAKRYLRRGPDGGPGAVRGPGRAERRWH